MLYFDKVEIKTALQNFKPSDFDHWEHENKPTYLCVENTQIVSDDGDYSELLRDE